MGNGDALDRDTRIIMHDSIASSPGAPLPAVLGIHVVDGRWPDCQTVSSLKWVNVLRVKHFSAESAFERNQLLFSRFQRQIPLLRLE